MCVCVYVLVCVYVCARRANGTDGDMVGVAGLVAALRSLPKDETDPNSYSLVPVHAWSHSYADVVQAADQLRAAGGFEVCVIFLKSTRESAPQCETLCNVKHFPLCNIYSKH